MRVIVSLTTIPSRVAYLDKILNCLRNQTYPIDKIYLNLPEDSRREGRPYPELPTTLDLRGVKVVRCLDLGPITKIAPMLQFENDPDTLIVTVDDDIEYAPTRIEELVYWSQRFPDSAIGGSGKIVGEWWNCFGYVRHVERPVPVSIIEGYSGCIYRRKFFTTDLLNYTGAPSGAFYNDDVWISGHLARKGIERLVHPNRSALHNQRLPGALSGEWANFLQRFLPTVWHFKRQGLFNEPQLMPPNKTVGFWAALGILFLILGGTWTYQKISQ